MKKERGRNKVWLAIGVLAGAGFGLMVATVALLALALPGWVPGIPTPPATLAPSAAFPMLGQPSPAHSDPLPATFTPAPGPTPAGMIVAGSEPTPAATVITPPSDAGPQGRIVFTCFIAGSDDICSLDASSGEVQRLTVFPATDFYPEWGPSGELVVFSSRRDGAFQLYAMRTDGSDLQRVSRDAGPSQGGFFAPHFSPDGQRLVFARAQEGTQHIWVMDWTSKEAWALTGGPFNDIDPVWSPDGTKIAFASNRGARQAHWIMNADGSNMRQLPDDVAQHGGRSDWSPDGRWLAFYAGPRRDRDIYLVATDGSGQTRRLTAGGRNLAPSFSPDGRWIVFTSYREGDDAEIFIMRSDGSEVRQLTFNARPDWQPRWGP